MKTLALSQLRFCAHVCAGDVIGWPQGPGEPLALTEALVAQASDLERPTLFFGLTQSETLRPELGTHFRFRALNGAGTSRRVTSISEIVPCHVSSIPSLIRMGTLRADVVLVQVRPLPGGQYTLGVIADFTQALIQQARVVIALLNPALPLVGGDACVNGEDIDILVESDTRIIDLPDPEPSPVEQQVAQEVSALIPDRATIQLGVGTLPAAVARSLRQHEGLGVHSGVVSDVLVDLIEAGVVTNAHKSLDPGLTVTGGLFGTRRLRDFAERTQQVALRSADYTHNLAVAGQLSNFHTVNSVIEIDLTGQANSEIAGGRYLGAVGGQVDFVRAGVLSPGGRSIVAMPSTTPDGRHSRIVASLGSRPVTTARSEIDIVVTEHGTAHLRGCSLHERARRLAAIAHPDHRESLERALYDGTPAC
ncbi:acetyl-CoA hydrolase/transferase family protein [Azohydromonas australica]|uniref:acetyl-CoA hydrolase/transferase family protein n=1 Tax=Azohydromonas australica TaxID=364039 RepID=UPI0004039794|nr:acetyl-CoA hydrolase/transferase C-terminal domain-containing protein [Azohydromonas australica]